MKLYFEDYLYEMATVSKTDTKLPYDLWIDSVGRDRQTEHNLPRIKVDVDGDRIPVSISDDPEILIANKSIPKFSEIKKYIKKYKDVFIRHWNKEISDRQALNELNEK